MADDSDDPVVREIPVFLSTDLSDVLYLIQHPHFNINRVEVNSGQSLGEPPLPKSARIRPKHGKLELFTPIPTVGADGYTHEHFDQDASDRQCIKEHRTVSSKVELQTHFAIGAMREGSLHLTPVRRILQMRASLGHIDEFEEKELMEMETIDEKPAVTANATKEKERTVVSGYQKRESDRAKSARLSSWAHQHKSELAENFVSLTVHGSGSEVSDVEFQRMFCGGSLMGCPHSFQSLVDAATPNNLMGGYEVESYEPASVAANSSLMPPHLAQLPIKKRIFLLSCAHAYIQQYGNFTAKDSSALFDTSPNQSKVATEKRRLFTKMCEVLACTDSVASDAFLWFSQPLPDFEMKSMSCPFKGDAVYNYLTEESIKLTNTKPPVSDAINVAAKKAVAAGASAQENRGDLKANINALIASEAYVGLLFANTYNLIELKAECSLEDKVHALIRRANVMPYDILLALSPGSSAERVLENAFHFAHVIGGNLVLRSDYLYGGETAAMSLTDPTLTSILTALATEPTSESELVLCSIRDTILAILDRDGFVGRLALNEMFKLYLTTHQIKTLLCSITTLDRPTRRWYLKHPDCSQKMRRQFPKLHIPTIQMTDDVVEFMNHYDDYVADTKASLESGVDIPPLSAFEEGLNPRRVDMIDAKPGFDPAYTGGRKASLGY